MASAHGAAATCYYKHGVLLHSLLTRVGAEKGGWNRRMTWQLLPLARPERIIPPLPLEVSSPRDVVGAGLQSTTTPFEECDTRFQCTMTTAEFHTRRRRRRGWVRFPRRTARSEIRHSGGEILNGEGSAYRGTAIAPWSLKEPFSSSSLFGWWAASGCSAGGRGGGGGESLLLEIIQSQTRNPILTPRSDQSVDTGAPSFDAAAVTAAVGRKCRWSTGGLMTAGSLISRRQRGVKADCGFWEIGRRGGALSLPWWQQGVARQFLWGDCTRHIDGAESGNAPRTSAERTAGGEGAFAPSRRETAPAGDTFARGRGALPLSQRHGSRRSASSTVAAKKAGRKAGGGREAPVGNTDEDGDGGRWTAGAEERRASSRRERKEEEESDREEATERESDSLAAASGSRFFTLECAVRAETEVKRSKFLAMASPVANEEEALAFLQQVKQPSASHNCWAFQIGQRYRFSDDGEPGGTAGQPILGAIKSSGLDGVMVVVTRWFGGVKLGTGGLVRAYRGAASACLKDAPRKEVRPRLELRLDVPFGEVGVVYQLLSLYDAKKIEEEYPKKEEEEGDKDEQQTMRLTVLVEKEKANDLEEKLLNCSAGRVRVHR